MVRGTTSVSVSVQTESFSKIDLFVDSSLKYSSSSSSFVYKLDSGSLAEGWHNLVVHLVKTDGALNSLTLSFDVANRPPKIERLSITKGVISGLFTITCRARDPSGLKNITLIEGSKPIAVRSRPPYRFRLNSRVFRNGLLRFHCRVVDVGGNSSTVSTYCYVFNVIAEKIGYSVKKRPIYLYHLGTTTSANKTLLVGAYHGSEGKTNWLLRRMIKALKKRVDLLRTGEVIILPCLNPDGLAAHTRWNARHVDLNRNFPVRWGGVGVTGPQGAHYPGKRPFSEPESRAFRDFLLKNKIKKMISYHSDLKITYSNSLLGRKMAAVTGYAFRDVGYPTPGSAQQWTKKAFPKMVYVLVELPGGRVTERLFSVNFKSLAIAVRFRVGA